MEKLVESILLRYATKDEVTIEETTKAILDLFGVSDMLPVEFGRKMNNGNVWLNVDGHPLIEIIDAHKKYDAVMLADNIIKALGNYR